MFKKLLVWFLAIIMTVSLLINYHQYSQIRDFKNKQYNIDTELKAQIQALITYLEDINRLDKTELEEQMKLLYSSFNFSSYRQNQTVSDTFYKLQILIYKEEDISTDKASEIGGLLKEMIKPDKSVIDTEACKKLDDYIMSIFSM